MPRARCSNRATPPIGFQYVSVRGLADTLEPEDILGCMVQTDLERLGDFWCSDGRLNKLHDIVEWSFRDNACEVPTDCPQREKAGWTGDWQLFVPTAAYLFDVAGFTAKWLKDVRTDQWENGVMVNIDPPRVGRNRCRIHSLHERVSGLGGCDHHGALGDLPRHR